MQQRVRSPHEMLMTAARLTPALATSLYGGRLLAEWTPAPGWAGVLGFLVAAGWLVYRWPLRHTWPAWGLAGYIFYPEPDPRVAGLAAAATLLLFAFNWRPIWLTPCRLSAKWGNGALAAGIFASALFLYSQTTASSILPADNGEFQLVAARLGVAHPPGFPLYTMLAHLAAWLPAGATAAYQINAFSGVISAATLALVYLSAVDLTGRKSSGLLACLALGTATTFAAQATMANVRSLTAFFAAAALYALIRLERHLRAHPSATRLPPWLPLLALILSLGVTHHPSLAFMGLVWAISALFWMPTLLAAPRRWLPLLAAVLAGLLPLLYLPLRAAAGAWGAPASLATWDGFWQHVLARGFAGDFFYFWQPAILWQRLGVMVNVLTFQFSPWLLAGMILGLLWLARQNPRLALALGGGFGLHTVITAAYRAPQTVEYMMPAYVPLALCLGCALNLIPVGQSAVRQAGMTLLAAGLFLAGGVQAIQHYGNFTVDPSLDTIDYTNYILNNAPPNSVILANWHWVTPLWYSQQVSGMRPDLRIEYVPPGAEPYAQTWASQIQAELSAGQDVITTWYDANAYALLPPPEPFGEAFWFRQTPRAHLPPSYTPLDLHLGSAHFLGYELQPAVAAIGQETVLTVAWSPAASQSVPLSLYAHGIQEGKGLIAQADETALAADAGITLTQFRLTPRPGSAPGEMGILLGVAGAEEPAAVITSMTLTPSQHAAYTTHPVYRTIPSGRPLLRLVGYDWDTTLAGQTRLYLHWQTEQGYQTEVRDNVNPQDTGLPDWFGAWGRLRPFRLEPPDGQHYVPFGQGIIWTGGGVSPSAPLSPGQSLTVAPRFHSQEVMQRDLVVSVRLVGYEADGFHWAWWALADGVPALGGIPTLKWIRGSQVRDPHLLQTAAAAAPGQSVEALLRLYDAFSQRPLPILDERLAAQAVWVSLGQTTVRP